jgi:hypothetical protein
MVTSPLRSRSPKTLGLVNHRGQCHQVVSESARESSTPPPEAHLMTLFRDHAAADRDHLWASAPVLSVDGIDDHIEPPGRWRNVAVKPL